MNTIAATRPSPLARWGGARRSSLGGAVRDRHDPALLRRAGLGAGPRRPAKIIASYSKASHRDRINKWAGWLGIVAAILGLASILFFTQLAIGIWIVAGSLMLFLRSGREDTNMGTLPA
jgi:hypothetical protein